MDYKYGSDVTFQALIAKIQDLIDATENVASNAQATANKAVADAAAAQSTADSALARTLTEISGTLTIAKGGTGATTAAAARTNLGITPSNIGAAPATHTHNASDISAGTLSVARGGTGASDAATARENLEITPDNIGASATGHKHSASDITSGTLAVARGGTGLTASPSMLVNLASGTAGTVFAASPRPGVTGTLPIANGGTGATTASAALTALGAAAASHNHSATNITSGTLAVARGGTGITANPSMIVDLESDTAASVFAASPSPGVTGVLPVANGGTGADDAKTARTNLGITLANLGAAAASHNHSASNITSGTLTVARGGTGITANPSMLVNLASNTAGSVFTTSPRPGVTGVLPVANGGTGSSTAADALTALGAAAKSHNHSATNITSGTLAVARGGTGLTASPSMLVNLGSTSAATILTASPRPGVTGTLPVANGGTGATDAATARTNLGITLDNLGAAAKSHNHSASNITSGTLAVARGGTGLTASPSMLVNLASTSAASVFATSPRPGVTGTLPIARGGTGATTAGAATNSLAAVSLAPGVEIAEDDDLDDYIDPGCFVCTSGTIAATLVNPPTTGSGFMLSVFKTYGLASANAYRTQIALTYSGNIYCRYRNSSSVWSDWDAWDITGKNYYPTTWTWTAGTTAGPTAKLTGSGMSAVSVGAIPAASASAAGIVTTGAQTFAGTKTFSSTISGSINGNAATATKLKTARTITVDLASTSGASFNGSANVTPGVSGVLPVANGGTGSSTAADALTALGAAAKSHNHSATNITSGTLAVGRGGTGLTASPSMLVNLASTTAGSVFTASPRPGVTGTLPIANGGTGATSASAALTALGAAAKSHNHSATNITSGTLAVARGGTGITANPSMLVNLGSTTAASVFATSPRPGVTGTLPIARGGTGSTTAANARTALGAAEGYTKSASVSAAGWYRIATSAAGISNNIGLFSIRGAVSGKHSNIILAAGISYGDYPDIAQILVSNFSTPSITKARIVYHGTYNNNYAYLEIYANVTTATAIDVSMTLSEGWSLVAPNTAGSIPSGYTSKEYTLANGTIGGYTASRALVTNSSGVITESAVTSTELGYLDGVTSAIQTQLNAKAASSHNHSAANITSGTLTVARGGTGVTANPSMLVNLASTSAANVFAASPRPGVTGVLPVANGGTGADDAKTARTNLGITLANLGAAAASHNHSASNITSGTLTVARGGTGVTSNPSLLVNLASTSAASVFAASPRPGVTGILPIARGGTGATSAAAALTALGAARRAYYTCNVATSSWTANSGGGYYKTITVSGILATDVPVVGVVLSSTVETAKLQGAAFACINRITTAANSITCYAYNSAPTTAITLQLLVVR